MVFEAFDVSELKQVLDLVGVVRSQFLKGFLLLPSRTLSFCIFELISSSWLVSEYTVLIVAKRFWFLDWIILFNRRTSEQNPMILLNEDPNKPCCEQIPYVQFA